MQGAEKWVRRTVKNWLIGTNEPPSPEGHLSSNLKSVDRPNLEACHWKVFGLLLGSQSNMVQRFERPT